MFKKFNFSRLTKKQKIIIGASIAVIVIIISGIVAYSIAASQKKEDPSRPKNVMPYVDGRVAKDQVENFYTQYINPQLVNRRKLVQQAGNSNLLFYYDYYQHGFDPIVCATALPMKVTTSLKSTGTSALINVNAIYPDGTKQEIVARVVLGNGVDIDSVTCPGDKGNLPYAP